MVAELLVRRSLSAEEQRRLRQAIEARSIELRRESLPEQVQRRVDGGAAAIHIIGQGASPRYAQCTEGPEGLECWVLGDDLDDSILSVIKELASGQSAGWVIWRRATLADDPPLEGMTLRREILRMDADIGGFVAVEAPSSLRKRPFRPEVDAEGWIALNALAFRDHPEQSTVGRRELSALLDEPWFDPGGFLLIEDDEGLAGFCWTKVHRDPWGTSGEIYVIGVAPRCAGRGIGRFAVSCGLAHLQGLGVVDAFLYVEASNAAAVRLYHSLGFEERWRDQLWEAGS